MARRNPTRRRRRRRQLLEARYAWAWSDGDAKTKMVTATVAETVAALRSGALYQEGEGIWHRRTGG